MTMSSLNAITNGEAANATPVNDNFSTLAAYVDADLLNRDGSVAMLATADLTLGRAPTSDLHAATKLYVDDAAWSGDWVSFTPAWTNLTVGAGVNTGEYCYSPGGMWVRGAWVFGAGAAVGTSPTLTLPNSETLRDNSTMPMGRAQCLDADGLRYPADIWWASSTTVGFALGLITAFIPAWTNITASVPMTWTTGDKLLYQFFAPL